MNLQSLLSSLLSAIQSLAQSIPPPSPFVYGLLLGTFAGLVLASLIMGRHALGAFLRRSLATAAGFAPAVLAFLLWGAWIGILAAKDVVR
jgi:hypothetical protein